MDPNKFTYTISQQYGSPLPGSKYIQKISGVYLH